MIIANNKGALTPKEWNEIYDKYMETNRLACYEYESLDPYQTFAIQTHKRHIKRKKSRIQNNGDWDGEPILRQKTAGEVILQELNN